MQLATASVPSFARTANCSPQLKGVLKRRARKKLKKSARVRDSRRDEMIANTF